jgi:hypothetical protein
MENISKDVEQLDLSKLSLNEQNKIKSFSYREYSIITKLPGEYKISLPVEFLDSLNLEEDYTGNLFIEKNLLSSFINLSKDSIDLSANPFILNQMILQSMFSIFGSINSQNDFLQFSSDEYLVVEKENYLESFIDKHFKDYIEKNISIIFSKFKIKDLDTFTKALKFIGVKIDFLIDSKSSSSNIEINNSLYTKIKNFVMSLNKLLILVAPSNNFWIKSEKITIGTVSYDRKINNYSHIFMNWEFVKKFYERVANHPRCILGFLNSMQRKNLVGCVETIGVGVKNFTKFLLFDQDTHENIAPSGNRPKFMRNMEKIKNRCKTSGCDTKFNETNIIILESENDKITPETSSNSIMVNIFSEEFMTYTPEEKELFKLRVEKLLSYLEKLLNDADGDLREWIANNPFN